MRWVKRALPLCSSEAGAKPVFGDRDEHDMWCIASQPLAQHRFACAPAAMPMDGRDTPPYDRNLPHDTRHQDAHSP